MGEWGTHGGWTQHNGEGMLASAIPEAVTTILPLETEWDQAKLEKKLRDYFNKGAKNLQFRGKALPELINEYADNAISSLFAGLGDREWLYTGQTDFLLLVDAGVKDNFPSHVLRGVQQLDFEQMVLAAYERAFDEQRFCPILSEAVGATVSGPKIKKKVWNAVDAGRKDAVLNAIDNADDFTTTWITSSVAHLSQASQGSPESTMTAELCCALFQALLTNGALPLSLTEGVEAPLHLVDPAVEAAYAEHTVAEEQEPSGPPAKKWKGAGYSVW